MLILVAVLMLSARLFTKSVKQENNQPLEERRWQVVGLGALVGFCVSVTSIGSGAMTVPPYLSLTAQTRSEAGSGFQHCVRRGIGAHLRGGPPGLGDVDLKVTLDLLLGSLPGVFYRQ